jgi:hypothetical protein
MDMGNELRFQSSRTKLVLMERVGGEDDGWESYIAIDPVRSTDDCGVGENALRS